MIRSRLLVLVNEQARSGRRALDRLRRVLPANGCAIHPVYGSAPPPAAAYDRVVVVGGDGSVRHLVPCLGEARSVAIVPAGTGNNLSKALGIPRNIEEAAELAVSGLTIRRLDVFEATGPAGAVHVVTHAALAFAARVAAAYARFRTTAPGRLACYPWGEGVYRLLSLVELALGDWPEYRLRIELGDRTVETRAAAVFLGNHAGIGGRFFPCPGAEPDDGVIHICAIGTPRTRLDALRLMREVARGAHVLSHELPRGEVSLDIPTSRPELVRLWRSRGPVALTFVRRAPRAGLLADGDLFPVGRRLDLRVVPRCLPLVVPAGSRRCPPNGCGLAP